MKVFMFVLGSVFLVYMLFAILLYLYQRSFIYFPSAASSDNLPVESFFNQGEQIDVLVLNPGSKRAVIYFGGNAESVANSAVTLGKALAGHTLYAVNYRGYASSTGVPTEKALNSDALQFYDILARRHSSVAVIGRSLGSGVATYLAAEREIEKMALITPYDSVMNVARDRFSIFPIALLLKDKFDSVAKVPQIAAKTLIILAEHDQVIAAKYSQRLIAAFPEAQRTVHIIAGSGHNDLSNKAEYYALLRDFF